MRPGQQNKRMRGRSRRGPSPLSRTYESNGPDVKIRGTASHIAEKYQQLARDAQSSGDHVSSENYLQHAEHYLRIIAAAQAQNQQQNPNEQPRGRGDDSDDDDDGQSMQQGRNDQGRDQRRDKQRGDRPQAVNDPQPDPSQQPQPVVAEAEQPAGGAAEAKDQPSGRRDAKSDDGDDKAKANGSQPAPRRRRRKPAAEAADEQAAQSGDAQSGDASGDKAKVNGNGGEQPAPEQVAEPVAEQPKIQAAGGEVSDQPLLTGEA